MDSKTKVEVTEKTYANYKVLMGFFRLTGFFPVTVQKDGEKIWLGLSPLVLVVWWIIAGFFILTTYWGMILDSKSKSASIVIEADTDKLMLLTQATQYSAIVVVGAFINPCRFRKLFDYIRCINEVDSMINTTYSESQKYKLLLAGLLILTYNVIFGWLYVAGCYFIYVDSLGLLEVLKRYTSVNVVAYLAWVSEYVILVLMKSLETRIRKLNEVLALKYNELVQTNRVDFLGGHVRIVSQAIGRPEAHLQLCHSKIPSFGGLSQVYLRLMYAADLLNNFVQLHLLITTMAVFWSLIYILYFSMVLLTHGRGENVRTYEMTSMCLQLMAHTVRGLMIVNPAYDCLIAIQKTKGWVCKILTCNLTRQCRKQVDRLVIVLGLRQLQFSACGYVTVDRLLFVSMIDTITTILMVLYQYRSSLDLDF